MLLKSGNRLDVYIIEDELGSGGMGAVYRVRDDMLRRIVAIKLLRHGRSSRKLHGLECLPSQRSALEILNSNNW